MVLDMHFFPDTLIMSENFENLGNYCSAFQVQKSTRDMLL